MKSALSNFAAKVPAGRAVNASSMRRNSETVPVQMAILPHVCLKTRRLPFTLFWFMLRKEKLRMTAESGVCGLTNGRDYLSGLANSWASKGLGWKQAFHM